MVHLAESLRIVAILLQPIMTETPANIFHQLGLTSEAMDLKDLRFGEFPSDTKVVAKGTPIFPRLELETEVAYIQKKWRKERKALLKQSNGTQKKRFLLLKNRDQIR